MEGAILERCTAPRDEPYHVEMAGTGEWRNSAIRSPSDREPEPRYYSKSRTIASRDYDMRDVATSPARLSRATRKKEERIDANDAPPILGLSPAVPVQRRSRRPRRRDRTAIHDVGSELDLLRHAEGMIDCDAEITDRAFEFGVYGQKLNGPQVAGLLVDLGCLRPAH